MTVFTYSRVAAYNPNTSPTSVARSASGSVYDIGDTGFLTPLNLTLVATNTVTTTLVSDANAMFPDFTLVDRTSVVFKSGSTAMVLTTTTPIAGPTGTAGAAGKSITGAAASGGNLVLTLSDSTTLAPIPLPTGAAIDDSSAAYLVGSGTLTKAAVDARILTQVPSQVASALATDPTPANAAAAAVQNAMATQYLSYSLVAGYASTSGTFAAYAGSPTYTTPAKFTASFGGGSVNKTGMTEPTLSWTVEAWVYAAAPHTGTANPKVVWGFGGGTWLGAMPDTGYAVWCQASADGTRRLTTVNIADGAWHHVAVQFQRIGGITTPQGFYIDGVLIADSGTTSALSWTATVTVGGMGTSSLDWHGRIDEFRISTMKRYTANFTPPAAAFTFDPATLILAHLENNTYLTPGGTGYPTRPVNAPGGSVTYTGPLQPTDWITGDKWVQQ